MIVYPDPAGGEKKEGVRPPPPPPIAIRTMDADVRSMQDSGGGAPQEEVLNAPRAPFIAEVPKPSDEDFQIKIPGYTGPEKSVFSSTSLPTPERGADLSDATIPQNNNEDGGSSTKKIVALIITIIVAALIGAGLYFFVYPMLLSNPNPSPTPVASSPTPTQIASSPTPVILSHVSMIKSDKSEEASSLSAATSETVASGKSLIKEIILKKDGNAIPLSNYLSALIPEMSVQELRNTFDEDFTAFIYYNNNGAWPGYVFKRKQGISSVVAQNSFRKIESSNSLNNLFLSDAGAKQGEFKSGGYKEVSTRYLIFSNKVSNKGGSISYAWIEDRLLITTIFPALQALIDGGLLKSAGNTATPTPAQVTDNSPKGVYLSYRGEMDAITSTDPAKVFEKAKEISLKYSSIANKKTVEAQTLGDIPPNLLAVLVESIKAISVSDLKKASLKESITGSKATLDITLASPISIVGANVNTGTISMVKEGGVWKLDSENWKMGGYN